MEWKNKKDKKTLVIQGARQVGKTWLMKEFGRREYQKTAYFNFEVSMELRSIFKAGFEVPKLISALNILADMRIQAEDTLIILK